MQNFAAIRSAVLKKVTFEVTIFGYFPDIVTPVVSGCDVVKLYVLQSFRSCTFCKRKTRGETQFWMELPAPYTLANHDEINSYQPCSLWRHKQTLFRVIRSLAGGKCRTLIAESLNDIFFIYISAFTVCFAFGVLLYIVTNRVTILYQNCIHFNSNLTHCVWVNESNI